MDYDVNDNDLDLCQEIDGLINTDASENVKFFGSNSNGIDPMCYVLNDKSFEIYYNDEDKIWRINRCNNDCNSNFTACHQNRYDRSTPCNSGAYDMKLFVDTNVEGNLWGENGYRYIGSITETSGAGNLCYDGTMLIVDHCNISQNVFSQNSADNECVLYGIPNNFNDSLCIDLYNQATFEHISIALNRPGNGVRTEIKRCLGGCNAYYTGCR
jgi:hypothetical protein